MRYKFKNKGTEVIFDDVTLKSNEGDNHWSQICKTCVEKHNIPEEKLDDVGSGICGVEGCSNESDHYIDFNDTDLIEYSDSSIERQNLVAYYEQNLEKVKAMHSNENVTSDLIRDKNNGYIEFAEKELEAVKNGRMW